MFGGLLRNKFCSRVGIKSCYLGIVVLMVLKCKVRLFFLGISLVFFGVLRYRFIL